MRFAILALLAMGPLLAQPTTRFQISGKVLDADTGRPIPRARVMVHRTTALQFDRIPGGFDVSDRVQVVVLTDESGSFRVTNASPGPYAIGGQRAGYTPVSRPDRPGSVRISIDQVSPSPVTIYLRRLPSIEGTLLHESGLAAPGRVYLIRLVILNGRPVPVPEKNMSLDPSGSFRMAGLNPGRYYLAYVPESGNRRGLTPTLYPGVPDMKGARLLELPPGREEQIHMRVRTGPVFEIHGVIAGGDESTTVFLRQRSRGLPFSVNAGERFDTSAMFHFSRVPAGEYLLTARSGKDSVIASGNITVSNQNLENIVLPPGPSVSLGLRITLDAPPVPDAPPPWVAFSLHSDSGVVATRSASRNAYVLEDPPIGVHRLTATFENPGYVRSARQGGRDVLREGVLVTPGANPEPVDIVIGYGKGRVEASVEASQTAQTSVSIVLLRRTGADLVRQEQKPGPGTLPPGEYLAFAWDNTGGDAGLVPYNTEEFHRKFGSYLERFTIRDSETVNLRLRRVLPAAALEAY